MKYVIGVIVLIILGGGLWFLNTESFQRSFKSTKSNYLGGLERVCELASSNGTVIRTYKGKIDFAETKEANKVLFDQNNRRTIIVVGGGTWVCDEK